MSAQKNLAFPLAIRPRDLEGATQKLFFGHETDHNRNFYRWQRTPEISLLNDYESLLEYLFSQEHDRSVRYPKQMKVSKEKVDPPETKLDLVKRLCEELLPGRELVIGGSKAEAQDRGGEPYHAKEMSDGERVVFYLIAEVLSVPEDGVFVEEKRAVLTM